MQIIDCTQNSPEWLQARAGIATASQFATIIASGKTAGSPSVGRRTYMLKLAGEIITGEPMESFSNEHTERGHAMEDQARDLYAFQTGYQLERVGFIRDGRKGASPDSLIGEDGGAIAIYWPKMPLFVKRMHRDELYIQKLATAVDTFNAELDDVVAQIRRTGERVAA